jgi:hypothetical protein
MDIHHKIDGLTADAVAHAYEKYWFDERSGKVFCPVSVPSKEAAAAVHREAHGLEADEIIEVQDGV